VLVDGKQDAKAFACAYVGFFTQSIMLWAFSIEDCG
jgi:hypothetical protein